MSDKTAHRFNWWLPVYGWLGAIIVLLPKLVFGNNIGPFLMALLLAPTVGLILLAVFFLKARRQTIAALSMIAIFAVASWLLFKVLDDLRTRGRWLTHPARYKAEVLAQTNLPNGDLKHAEWDGWGFPGADTTVYLVFDP